MPVSPEILSLNEADARRLLLARAVDEADAPQQLVGAVERDQIEREALAVAGDPALGRELDAKAYLLERAQRLLALVAHRRPRIAALAEPSPWTAALAWAVPLLAFAAGAALDRIDNPQQVNLLSPPLLAFLFWNLAVYVGLAVLAVRPLRAPRRSLWEHLPAWPRAGGLQAQVATRFHAAWWRTAGTLESQRWRRVLHLSAAAWGLGVALSIVLGGLVREYRVGWESTLLDLPQVHAFLRALFAPVVALTPLQGFSPDDLARLHFRSGVVPGREEARHWVFLYLALIALVVIVPRLALAAWAAARQKLAARALRMPVDDAYFTPLLGRVRPVRLQLRFTGGEEELRRVSTVLRQAGGERGPARAGEGWTVLRSERGDTLEVRSSDSPGGLFIAVKGAEGEGELLALGLCPTWRQDGALHAVVMRLLAPWQAPGAQRLWERWDAIAQQRLSASAQLLAAELAQAAVDVETLASQPAGVRQYVLREGRDAAQAARTEATAALLERVRQRRSSGDARLLELHMLDPAAARAEDEVTGAVRIAQAIHEPQAGLAGAASGAAMGATIDLMTGGLTLGAAAALGAIVGGGAALVGAAWKNRSAPADRMTVALGEDMLRALAQGALVRYLRVAHAGRGEPREDAWRSLAEEIVTGDVAQLQACWKALRENENAAGAEAALAAWLRASILRALETPFRSAGSA